MLRNLLIPFLLYSAWASAGTFSFDLKDTQGVRHTAAEIASSKAVVFAFVATDCPIGNSYVPELSRLYAEYSKRGVVFYAVHSDPSVSTAAVRKYAHDYHYPFPVLLDRRQTLARRTGATATLEIAVVSPSGKLLYRGRVDDRNIDFGKSRQRVVRHDLRIALDEILAGKQVTRRITKALGCAIPFPAPVTSTKVTFAHDIAPILYKHCTICHHSGEVAPFPLLTYKDVAKRASLIARVTASRYMPPWKPVAGYGDFKNERRLTAADIARFQQWSKEGAPEGNPAELPPQPHYSKGWLLGKPDMIVRMPIPYTVPADGTDIYRCFVIPLNLKKDRYVKTVEFHPGNRKVVHHALFFLDVSGLGRRLDASQPGPGYSCFGSPGFLPSGSLAGWTPGTLAIHLAGGIPMTVRKYSDLVAQIHFHPTGKPEQEQASFGLYFTDKPPKKHLMDIGLASHDIDIPAGDSDYKVTDHFTLPVPVEVLGIIPHAHYVCRDMKGWAILPNGKKKWLIWIKDWDFNWQGQYFYKQPIHLPAGTELKMLFTYDNSTNNPRNPNNPPKRVTWGLGSKDEMAGLHVQVVTDNPADATELDRALWGKVVRLLGIGFPHRR